MLSKFYTAVMDVNKKFDSINEPFRSILFGLFFILLIILVALHFPKTFIVISLCIILMRYWYLTSKEKDE